jgi:recombination protein RecA
MKEQILLGTLLGDASISKLINRRKKYSIRWEHCLKQKEYAIWKAENSLDHFSIYERTRFDNRTKKKYTSITCYSIIDDYLKYRKLFYNEKKIITDEILNLLEPLAIAVWYMDDGSLYYNGNNCHLTLAVNSFDAEEVELIINYFKNKFDINFKYNKKQIRLTSVKEVLKFESFFKRFYHPTMEYKTLEVKKKLHKGKL